MLRSTFVKFSFILLPLISCGPRDNVILPDGAITPTAGKVQLLWSAAKDHAEISGDSPTKQIIGNISADSFRQRVEKEQVEPHVQGLFLEKFSRALSDKGFSVIAKKEAIENKKFRESIDTDAAYVMYIRVQRVGVTRQEYLKDIFYTPKCTTYIDAIVLSKHEKRIIAEHHPRVEVEALNGDWGTSPHYLKLTACIREAFVQAMGEIEMNFLRTGK